MQVVKTPSELRRASRRARSEGARVALVPTMGALHAGHLSLVQRAREHADRVVMSVFVNPTQFGPGEDFESYPRDFDRDRQLAEGAGVDILFHPAVEALYPAGNATRVQVEGLGDGLCGRTRPEHFRGVTTVVAKLLLVSEPDVAVFGRKDYQQWRILERMATDLLLEVEVVGAPIVREPDGLALSSRNRYLSAEEREAALALPRALSAGADAVSGGERNPGRVVAVMREVLAREPLARADYLEVVNAEDLQPLQVLQGNVLLTGAAHVGATRLIDNREIII